jgi:hypothetical protein
VIKKIIGSTIVGTILTSTLLAVLGIWGVIGGETVWQLFLTLIATAGGLSAVGAVADAYFFKESNDE